MENLETETLYLHEGHEDEFGEEDDMAMDEDHPMWRSERITLNSVGIDIGSSTSHLIFSRLTLRRQGIALSSRFVVVNREILHESPILLTPYIDKTTIDTDKLDEFIHESYRQSGLTPNDIDTGAIIVTGEAAKEECRGHLGAVFGSSGKFVCATAGHNLEAILASYGSGAVHMTYHEGGDFTVMNVDVGGGTMQNRHRPAGEGHRHLRDGSWCAPRSPWTRTARSTDWKIPPSRSPRWLESISEFGRYHE